jgi:hypothetical protein
MTVSDSNEELVQICTAVAPLPDSESPQKLHQVSLSRSNQTTLYSLITIFNQRHLQLHKSSYSTLAASAESCWRGMPSSRLQLLTARRSSQ